MAGAKAWSRADVVRVLSTVELFAGLGPTVLDSLAGVAVPRSYPKGALLFAEGDPGSSLHVITTGAVTICRTAPTGERAVLTVLRPPDVLGELAIIDGAPRSATAEALSPTTTLSVGRDAFLALLRAQPALVDPLLRHLGEMVRRLSDQTADHVFLDLAGRVAKVLMRLAGPRRGGPPVVEFTQGRLAEMAGGSRQSVNQVLGAFATRGLVRVDGRRIVITDEAGLRRRAGLPPAEAGAGVRPPQQRPPTVPPLRVPG
jgi:CRP-like cAMP-binding protein